jgi:hypothetical protein
MGNASMAITAAAASASGLPGSGASFGTNACDAISGLATSSPWNCVRNLAAASRMAA